MGHPRLRFNPLKLALCLVVVYLVVTAGAHLFHLAVLRLELARTYRAIRQVEAANAVLREEIAYASTDEYVEQVARQLGLTKSGEVLYTAPPSGRKPSER